MSISSHFTNKETEAGPGCEKAASASPGVGRVSDCGGWPSRAGPAPGRSQVLVILRGILCFTWARRGNCTMYGQLRQRGRTRRWG